jgi:tetratricopeptide (TPR) repeat protein
LNTGWYIKQLKHRDPKVPISLSDDYIDMYLDRHDVNALMKRFWPKEKWNLKLDTPDGPISWECPATMYVPMRGAKPNENNFLRVQDIMILDIIRTNNWKRPIYFAVTVSSNNMMGLRDYLRMEGLALRLSSKKGQLVDPEALWKNLSQSYDGHYRNLDNPNIHYNNNIRKLLQNYRSAYLQLAFYHTGNMEPGTVPPIPYESMDEKIAHFDELTSGQKVEVILDKMSAVLPEEVIPITNPELQIQIGLLYSQIGRRDELKNKLDNLRDRENLTMMDRLRIGSVYLQYLNDKPGAVDQFTRITEERPLADSYIKIGTVYLQYGYNAEAEEAFQQALSLDAGQGQAVGGLLRVYDNTQQWQKAIDILETWIRANPGDPSAQRELNNYRQKLTEQDTSN